MLILSPRKTYLFTIQLTQKLKEVPRFRGDKFFGFTRNPKNLPFINILRNKFFFQSEPPLEDTSMDITVYSYLGKMSSTSLGHIYVNDTNPWSRAVKTFTLRQPSSAGFEVGSDGGIYMDIGQAPGSYKLTVDVEDHVRNQNTVATINIQVIEITETILEKQGVVQILLDSHTGLQEAADFLKSPGNGADSRLRIFKDLLSSKLDDADITVFSIQDFMMTIDVRFFGRNSNGFLDPVTINSVIALNQAEFERAIGATTVSVGIDECKYSTCDNGCRTINKADFVSSGFEN